MFRMITDHRNIFFYDIGRCSVTYSLKWAIKSHRNWVLNKTATPIVFRQTWFYFPSKSSRNIGESEGRRKHRRILFRAREKKREGFIVRQADNCFPSARILLAWICYGRETTEGKNELTVTCKLRRSEFNKWKLDETTKNAACTTNKAIAMLGEKHFEEIILQTSRPWLAQQETFFEMKYLSRRLYCCKT